MFYFQMNHSKEFILVIVILANFNIYCQENVGFFSEPLAYFGSPHISLYYQKVNNIKENCNK